MTVYTRPVDYDGYEGFNHIAVDPATDSHVVASKIDYHWFGELYESWDSGKTWTSTVPGGPMPNTPITALAINPHPPHDMWLAWFSGDRLRNEFDHWQDGYHDRMAVGIPTSPTVTSVLFDPLSSRTYVDVSDIGSKGSPP